MFFPIFVCFALIVSVLRVFVYKSTNIYSFFCRNFRIFVRGGHEKSPASVDGCGALWRAFQILDVAKHVCCQNGSSFGGAASSSLRFMSAISSGVIQSEAKKV